MSLKARLLAAIRDELKARLPEIGDRVFVVVQDAQGNQLLPKEAATPFLTVADAGLEYQWGDDQRAQLTYRVIVRAHVQDLRDVETPVVGHAPTGARGAAELQGLVTDILLDKLFEALGQNATAKPEREPPVDVIADEGWWAVIGDVQMRYDTWGVFP